MKIYNYTLINKISLGLVLAVCFGLFGINAAAQTIIAEQGFETTPPASPFAYTNTGGAVSTNAGATDTPANSRIRTGTQSFQVNNTTATLNFANTTIPAGYTGVQVIVHISSPSVNTTNGSDAPDSVSVSAALNGGVFPATPDITATGFSNARYGYSSAGITTSAGTPVSVAGSTASPISTLIINIPNGTTSVALRITATNDNANELWNIDDVTLQGFAPTAASVSVGGRVMEANGRGIYRARVVLVDAAGNLRAAYTNPFGFYRFEDVPAGETYIFSVSAKRFVFAAPNQVINLNESLPDVDFIGEER